MLANRILKLRRLPTVTTDQIFDEFLQFLDESQIKLYPAQEESILEIFAGKNVILNTPTGSGKSLVGLALHFCALARGKRSFYTGPIKALVHEKFFWLCKLFSPQFIGLSTGDATVNPSALLICCTAEILSNEALRLGKRAQIADVVMDEFHYYGDPERGMAWQVPLLTLPQTRFLLLSATFGNPHLFEGIVTSLNGLPTRVISSQDRPVPLYFEYKETPIHKTVTDCIQSGRYPIYLVHFTQRQCAEQAQNFLSLNFCSKDEKQTLQAALKNVHFESPYGKEVQKLIKNGIGIHHAGLLPKYKLLIESLAQKSLLKLICGTDTLGVGVNIPIKTVLFTQLYKFNGTKTTLLSVREFQQISGRAGRKGFDSKGYVLIQAPEHVIENLKKNEKKHLKTPKSRPPKTGFIPWNQETFLRLKDSSPEPLRSHFQVSHSLLLQIMSRNNLLLLENQKTENVCKTIRELIQNCHESKQRKKILKKKALQLYHSLLDRKILALNPLRIQDNYQKDFSLYQTLSLYLLDALESLDPNHPQFILDVLSLVEAILEDPQPILRKQLDKAKKLKWEQLKLQGASYEERQEALEKVDYPKPNASFIYQTFNHFAFHHPWIGEENIRPKSIARELYETFQSFSEYVQEYQLQRSEGLLLRYLSEVYKTLIQTVPDRFKNNEFASLVDYFKNFIQEIDSSLLEAWKQLKTPKMPTQFVAQVAPTLTVEDQLKNYQIQVRNLIYRFLQAFASKNYTRALSLLTPSETKPVFWTALQLENLLKEYESTGHSRIRVDTLARHPINTRFVETGHLSPRNPVWLVHQILIDPEECNDWEFIFTAGFLLPPSGSADPSPYLILHSLGAIA